MTHLRIAALADSTALFSLVKEFATSFKPNQEAFEESIARLIENDEALLIVAEQSGAICGYLLGFIHDSLFANGPVGWIEELMVRDDQRRNGVGSQLVAHFEQWARASDAKLIALATRRAAAFYQAIGYEESASYFRKML